MNKTLMLVICDFLLLSMLALARFDKSEMPEQTPEVAFDTTASSATAETDLIRLLEESLESELNSRANLSEDLAESRKSLQEKARILEEREAALQAARTNLEQQAAKTEELAQAKAETEADKQRLAAEKRRMESEREQLAEQHQELALKFESTRTQLENANTERIELAQSLGQLKAERSVAKERLSHTEEELIARELALAEREAELKAAREEARRLGEEREQLDRQLAVAQAERKLLEQNLGKQQLEKEQAIARAERLTENVSELGEGVSQLGQGVSTLAQTSQDIKKEIEASRPHTMSEIFTRFQNNRATIRFTSTERTLLGGQTERSYETKSILVSDTTGTYLVAHSTDTPFAFYKNPKGVLDVHLEVTLAGHSFPVEQISFLRADPRLIFIQLPESYVTASGLKTFGLARQPERWEEAVLIKHDESNFGRTDFRRLTSSERFLKMDRPALGELFADFASSRGDLAFSKNSQFIGILTDTTHAVVIDAFLASAVTDLGPDFNTANNTATIDRLKDSLRKLPLEVQTTGIALSH